ncbi:hypothetical protein REG_1112 [Candidatus Regiella insecticola LSR1]|uniref:Uncharacterized protein n=1 Tax=Candidatus Regiella insecticola LSR1 TaxID=663321 RepID=E0WSX7_9ENTR|nr:hypothetical protein [Candidatus Regiella insecticola]EFL91662.1 hypothetical protein REG_1112 [Candidatus Regiella insecticola LSR1]
MIQGGGAQTVQIVRQATTTQNQIKLIFGYRWPGRETDERRHTMRARAGSQQRDSFKGEGYT